MQPHFEAVDLTRGHVLIEAGAEIDAVYFIESGICSVLANFGEGRLEVGMAGPEGMVGASIALGIDRSPQTFMAQAEGKAWRVSTPVLRDTIGRHGSVEATILRYVHCFMLQTMQTAYANADFSIEERLARWILMTHDRLQSDDLPLTHDFLSLMLGTRRPSVTSAVHVLEGERLIRATRGNLRVLDRDGLRARAGAAYGVAEAEYDRVFGPNPEAADATVSP